MNVFVSYQGAYMVLGGEYLGFSMFESLVDVCVSTQGGSTALKGLLLDFFCVWVIYGHVCVIPMGSYVPHGGISWILFVVDGCVFASPRVSYFPNGGIPCNFCVLGIDKHGCVISRIIYGPKVVITWSFFSVAWNKDINGCGFVILRGS